MITLTREEAQQVLDALESCDQAEDLKGLMQWYDCKLIDAAVKIICLRLTEEQPKPLAYIHIKDDCIAGSHRKEGVFLPDGQYGLWPMETLRARLSAPEPDAPTPRDQYCYERGYQRALEVIRQTPQREWQGLTDEDRQELAAEQYGWEGLCSAVEAKLREKNA
jgi:hypothetical protein